MPTWNHLTPSPASFPPWKDISPRVEDGVGIIHMSRYSKRNALSAVMCDEMAACLDHWRYNDTVAVIIFTSTEEFFSAGMDLEEYLAVIPQESHRHMELFHRFFRTLVDFPKPTIAAVAGPAFAGGCDLLAHVDIRIMSQNAKIGMPQPKHGIHSHFSPLWRLVGPGYAKLMFFTGDMIDGNEAFRVGLADKLVPDGEVIKETLKVAKRMAKLGTAMQLRLKEVSMRAPTMEPISACAYETAMYRDVCQQEQHRAQVTASFAKIRSGDSPALAQKL